LATNRNRAPEKKNSASLSTNSTQGTDTAHHSHQQKSGSKREENQQQSVADRGRKQQPNNERSERQHRARELTLAEKLDEITMISLNIRGFNTEAKQQVIGDLITKEKVDLVCLNETKLQMPLYFSNYWSHQTMLQRNGGCWTAATNKVRMTLVKSLGTYLCWVRVTTGECEVQVLNCYLEPGEQVYQKERVKRVTDIIKDILR